MVPRVLLEASPAEVLVRKKQLSNAIDLIIKECQWVFLWITFLLYYLPLQTSKFANSWFEYGNMFLAMMCWGLLRGPLCTAALRRYMEIVVFALHTWKDIKYETYTIIYIMVFDILNINYAMISSVNREMGFDGIVLESWSSWAAYGVLNDPKLRIMVISTYWTGYGQCCMCQRRNVELIPVISELKLC